MGMAHGMIDGVMASAALGAADAATAESGGHAGAGLFVALLAIFAAAAVAGVLFRRMKLQLIPAYLVAGAVIGPGGLGIVSDDAVVSGIAQPGIILLLFGIGLQLELSAMRRGMVSMLGTGAVSTALVVVLVWLIGMMGGMGGAAALAAGMALAISSTAVLLRALNERRELHSVHGRLCLGVAIVQDVLSVVMLALLAPLAEWAGTGAAAEAGDLPRWARVAAAAATSLGGVGLVLIAGRFVLPWVLTQAARAGQSKTTGVGSSGELVLLASTALALLTALATAAIGFSAELGAFIAGFMLAATPFRHQLVGQFAPMRDLLMAMFFTAVGLKISPGVIAEHWVVLVMATAGLMAVKAVVIAATAWGFGVAAPAAVVTGVYQGTAGEFSLVIIAAAGAMGILRPTEMGGLITVVVATLVVAPMLFDKAHAWGARTAGWPLAPWVKRMALGDVKRTEGTSGEAGGSAGGGAGGAGEPAAKDGHGPLQHGEVHGAAPAHDHVIIAGFGPVGRNLASRFAVQGVPFTVVELNPTTVRRQATIGRSVVYGDITNPEVLETAGIRQALALIVTIPDEDAMLRACGVARAMNAGLFIAARTSFLSGAFQAQQNGADHVIVEEIATAEAMERQVLAKLGALRKARAEADGVKADGAGGERSGG